MDEPGILGVDFLRAYHCYWDWGRDTLEIDGDVIKCRVPVLDEIPTVSIYVARSYTIPPQSEMIIEGEIKGALNELEWV